MRKVYIPVYLIEWSDIRPYALMAAHGLTVAGHYAMVGLTIFGIYLGKFLQALWIFLKKLLRLLLRGSIMLVKALWRGVERLFTVSNPTVEDDEEDDDDTPAQPEAGAKEEYEKPAPTVRTIFDED